MWWIDSPCDLAILIKVKTSSKKNSPPQSNPPPIGERPVVKSPCTMAGMHFWKLPNSYSLWVENCQLKSRTIKCPTSGANILFKSGQNPLLIPGRGAVGLNIDRRINKRTPLRPRAIHAECQHTSINFNKHYKYTCCIDKFTWCISSCHCSALVNFCSMGGVDRSSDPL